MELKFCWYSILYWLLSTINCYIWKELYFAWQALLIVRTCWIFQCYTFLFLGCKNMHLIGVHTWGFPRIWNTIYILDIDWYFFNCLFFVLRPNFHKYTAKTSVSYKYLLLNIWHLVSPQWNFKIFGNFSNMLSRLYPLNMPFQNLKNENDSQPNSYCN